ncbi:hypothetical protein BC829DRAFT_441903 [Chytridium lagenaria]|nr:hypothetical protein BC829DRAFT_441903 [Chytridium lagenaria]
MSIQALLIIAVSYSIAMWATYGVGLAVAPAPGIIYGITVLDRIPTDRNPFKTVYDAVSIFIDNTLSLARSNQISPNQPVIMDIIRDEVLISTGYNQFLHQFSRDTSLRLDLFVNVAAGVFAVVIATIFASYFLYWRRILDYLIVADIDSLRELLHLKRSKVSSKSAEITTQQQQLLIARSPSNAEQEHSVFHRRAGLIMGETPEVTPIDESFANRTVVAQFMEKMAGTAQPENNTTPPSSLPTSTGPPLQSIRGSMSNIANLPVRHRRSSYSSLHTAGIAENNSGRNASTPVPPIPESLRIGRRGSMRQAHIDMNKGVAVIRKETTSSEGGKKHGNQGDQDEDHS